MNDIIRNTDLGSNKVDYNDPWLRNAILQIYSGWGDRVSFEKKAKALSKFGRTENADDDVKTTVALFQDTGFEETFATRNSIGSVSSTDTGDAGEPVTIEGHTVDTGTGDMTFTVQSTTLNGQTPVQLATYLYRASRIYRPKDAWTTPTAIHRGFTGEICVYDTGIAGGVTAGEPNNPAASKVCVAAGKQQSEKCATSISASDYWAVTEVYAAVTRGGPQSAVVDIDVEFREQGGVWRPLGLELNINQGVNGYINDTFRPLYIIPKNSDVRMVATSSINNTKVSGYINGLLAVIY